MVSIVPVSVTSALKKAFADSRIRTGLFWNLMATVAGRSSGLVISIVLARALGKEVFGQFSIIQSTILTFGVFAGFGTGLTATKHIAETFRTDPKQSGRILALAILLAVAFGGIMTAALMVSAPPIAKYILSSPQLTGFLQIASLSLVTSALSGAQSGALAGFEDFHKLSKLNIYSAGISVSLVSLGVYLNGIRGALWAYNGATAISCYLGNRALKTAAANRDVSPDYTNSLSEWPILWRFSLPSMLANTLVTPAAWACNAMLVNQPGGFSEMAIYNVATQWRQLLLFLPGVTTQVFLPIMSSKSPNDALQSSQAVFMKINIFVTLPFLAGLLILSPLIMSLYGPNYSEHWIVLATVLLATFAQILQAPSITSWAAHGRMWTNLFANVFWSGVLIVLSWAMISMGALGLGLALLISFLLYFIAIMLLN